MLRKYPRTTYRRQWCLTCPSLEKIIGRYKAQISQKRRFMPLFWGLAGFILREYPLFSRVLLYFKHKKGRVLGGLCCVVVGLVGKDYVKQGKC